MNRSLPESTYQFGRRLGQSGCDAPHTDSAPIFHRSSHSVNRGCAARRVSPARETTPRTSTFRWKTPLSGVLLRFLCSGGRSLQCRRVASYTSPGDQPADVQDRRCAALLLVLLVRSACLSVTWAVRAATDPPASAPPPHLLRQPPAPAPPPAPDTNSDWPHYPAAYTAAIKVTGPTHPVPRQHLPPL